MLEDLGMIGAACAEWQMPLLVMIYTQAADLPDEGKNIAIAHAARVAAELGADCIKIPFPTRDKVLKGITSSLPVPVVVAGGARSGDTRSFLQGIEKSMEAGARRVAIGRNVFQHEQPKAVLNAICDIVHRGLSAASAWDGMAHQELV
ncbi:MAG: hypothetical protein HGB17_15010 [Syntrophobacteraceae bacterium]|nr:hypothetical protein [Syntrophobacteraceae bacterium]